MTDHGRAAGERKPWVRGIGGSRSGIRRDRGQRIWGSGDLGPKIPDPLPPIFGGQVFAPMPGSRGGCFGGNAGNRGGDSRGRAGLCVG